MFHFYQTVTALIVSSLLAPVSGCQSLRRRRRLGPSGASRLPEESCALITRFGDL